MATSEDPPTDAPWRDIDFDKVPAPEASGITITASGPEGMRATLRCTTATVDGTHMLKSGTFGRHTVLCDEGPMIGGDDAYPPPMAYIALGIGFCLLTQLGRYAGMLDVTIDRAECDVELDLGVTGSVLRGDVQAACPGVRTVVRVESSADHMTLLRVVDLARRGCFADAMVQAIVPTTSAIYLNGEPLAPDGVSG